MNVTSHDPRWQDLLPSLALEALEGEDRQQLEEHLASGCATCRAELEELERDLSVLAEAVSSVEPSPEIRHRLLDQLPDRVADRESTPRQRADNSASRVVPFDRRTAGGAASDASTGAADSPRPTASSSAGPWKILAWAAALVGVVLGVATLWQQRELVVVRHERDRLAEELEQNQGELVALRSEARALAGEAKALANEVNALTSRQARQVVLAGLEKAPSAKALAYVDEERSTARFYAFDLPEPPPGHDYQLWVIVDGTPASAGVFAVEADGSARVEIAALPETRPIDAWAVTLEPSGGVPQPTGPMVLLSS